MRSMNPAYVPRRAGVDAGAGVGREALDVSLVDDRLREGPAERPVALPVVDAEVDDDALHRRREVTAGELRALAVAGRDRDAAAVRVEQDAIRGEPQAALRRRWPMGAKAVHLARPDPGTNACQYGPVRSSPGRAR